jgi:hypothetical protein
MSDPRPHNNGKNSPIAGRQTLTRMAAQRIKGSFRSAWAERALHGAAKRKLAAWECRKCARRRGPHILSTPER